MKQRLYVKWHRQRAARLRRQFPTGPDFIHRYSHRQLSARPEFFSGTGRCVNAEQLEWIYGGIKTELGNQAAANFVQFVCDADTLFAASFLTDFHEFVANRCQPWQARRHTARDQVPIGEDDGRGITAMAGVAAFMSSGSGGHIDRTSPIKREFLPQHEGEYTEQQGADVYEDFMGLFGLMGWAN